MRRFLCYFTRDSELNDVIVHELMCSSLMKGYMPVKRIEFVFLLSKTHVVIVNISEFAD